MSSEADTAGGSAGAQGDLWGQRARDWADVMEGWSGWGIPVYRHVLERVPVERGTRLLDVGCGAGRFCRIAADRGAEVAGIDASAPFVEIARERTPHGDFRVGEMERFREETTRSTSSPASTRSSSRTTWSTRCARRGA